jgi:hypothetical protein
MVERRGKWGIPTKATYNSTLNKEPCINRICLAKVMTILVGGVQAVKSFADFCEALQYLPKLTFYPAKETIQMLKILGPIHT